MPQYETIVRGSVKDAADHLENEVPQSAFSAELLERYSLDATDGKSCVVMVFEKYYMRNSSRISLTVSVDDLGGATRVCATASGGGQSTFFSFDWGAGENFVDTIADILNGLK